MAKKRKRKRKRKKIIKKKRRHIQSVDKGAWKPSKKEIEAGCLRIQATWSDLVRAKRRAVPEVPYTIPEVIICDDFLDTE